MLGMKRSGVLERNVDGRYQELVFFVTLETAQEVCEPHLPFPSSHCPSDKSADCNRISRSPVRRPGQL